MSKPTQGHFRKMRRAALVGAAIALVYGAATRGQWMVGGDSAARLAGQLIGYAAGGAFLGAIVGRLLPS
jgi:hypothetical protein